MFNDLSNELLQNWNVTKVVNDFLHEKIQEIANDANITITIKDETEWEYFHQFRMLNGMKSSFDWYPKNLGKFFVDQLIYSLNTDLSGSYDLGMIIDSMKVADILDGIFTVPGMNVSLINIAHLFTINDFNQILAFETIKEGIEEDIVKKARNYIANFPNTFYECIIAEVDFFKNWTSSYMLTSPCLSNRHQSKCKDYCQWHKNLKNSLTNQDFRTIMKFALPQGKIVLDQDEHERELAKKVVGISTQKPKFSQVPLMIFCKYQKSWHWEGQDAGFITKVCEDFFPTPTHVGTCLTGGLDTKATFKNLEHMEIQNSKIIQGGTYSGVASFILDTNQGSNNKLFERTLDTQFDNVQMQIHPTTEMAQILFDEFQEFKTRSFKLKRGHEYTFQIGIQVMNTTEGFNDLPIGHRSLCKLPNEVEEHSWFQVYSQKNCIYECHAKSALEFCGCIPWDYYHIGEFLECDIFGRTCFLNAMENLTHQHGHPCQHCQSNCNSVQYNVELVKDEEISGERYGGKYVNYYFGKCQGNKLFCDYLEDKNHTLRDEYSKSKNNADRERQYEGMIVVNLKFESPNAELLLLDSRYTLMDKMSNLGASFGFFTQLTGCTILAASHLLISIFKELYHFGRMMLK